MTNAIGCVAGAAVAAAVLSMVAPAFAETLFKIVTVKDEIVVGLNDAELKELGGDAGGIAKAIAVTQKDGERMVAPRAKIGVLANTSLRVEPYKQPFNVLAHE